MQAIWDNRHRVAGKLGLVAAVACAAYVGVASWWVNVKYNADPREFLVTTQSSPEVKRVSKEVLARAAAARRQGRDLRVVVDTADGATFPYAWYLRDLDDAAYVDLTRSALPDADVAIVTAGGRARQAAALRDYAGREFPFRVWWVRDYGAMSPANWARWFTERKPWNPPGGMPEWLYVRRGA